MEALFISSQQMIFVVSLGDPPQQCQRATRATLGVLTGLTPAGRVLYH